MAEQRRRQQQHVGGQPTQTTNSLGQSTGPTQPTHSTQKSGQGWAGGIKPGPGSMQNGRSEHPLAASLDLSPLGHGAAAQWAGTL